MPDPDETITANRRTLLGFGARIGAGVGVGLGLGPLASPGSAQGRQRKPAAGALTTSARIDAHELGVLPDTGRDLSVGLQRAIDRATAAGATLVLAPGRHIVSGLKLRSGSRIEGGAGRTLLVGRGGGPICRADGGSDIALRGVMLVAGVSVAPVAKAVLELAGVRNLRLDEIAVEGGGANAIHLERCGGAVTGCRITGAAKAAIFSLDATGLEISHNTISDCGNNGILVWASRAGEDATLVAMNRIDRIASTDGGTGQNGNAINVFRAGNVMVCGNRIADCAFSAVRANGASNVQILDNGVSRAGEVALYAEFGFEGAVIAGNLVDTAATGISVTNFNEGGRLAVVQGNLIRDLVRRADGPDTSGIGIAVEADAAVTGNVVENASAAGISIGWGRFRRDVAATGNVIRGCGIGIGISGDAAGGAVLVASNLISGARGGAIRRLDHGRPVGGELAGARAALEGVTLSGNAVA